MDPEHRGAPYRDAQQPFDRRVADLLGRMTLEEKLAQMGCAWSTSLIRDGAFAPAKARTYVECKQGLWAQGANPNYQYAVCSSMGYKN